MQRPVKPWDGDEVAKRQRLLELAQVVAGGEAAWICVWDADYSLHKAPVGNTRAYLTDIHPAMRSVDVLFCDDPSFEEPNPASWYRMKMFMRLEPGMHMGANHYTYVYPDGESLWILPRDSDAVLCELRIRHLKMRRKPERITAQTSYYEIRDDQGLEPA